MSWSFQRVGEPSALPAAIDQAIEKYGAASPENHSRREFEDAAIHLKALILKNSNTFVVSITASGHANWQPDGSMVNAYCTVSLFAWTRERFSEDIRNLRDRELYDASPCGHPKAFLAHTHRLLEGPVATPRGLRSEYCKCVSYEVPQVCLVCELEKTQDALAAAEARNNNGDVKQR